MKTKNKKILRIIAILMLAGFVIGGSIMLYLFNMPHRDVQSAKADYVLTSNQIVSEYLSDMDAANQKYLSSDGESKILEISGIINNISEDFNGQTVLLLKGNEDKAGVSATLISNTSISASSLKIGDSVKLKGVIRSGASFDEDLELYENVILDKCDISII
ncbi:MAG: hypothetical protein GQ564_00540 [Bacteroidales bacterium]|nr:hypothetical protein [Bacteroidales bacterium]